MATSITAGAHKHGNASSLWKFTVAGLCSSLVGIGLARFAYTPLLPAIVGAHWFSASGAAYLGAANLLGYLAGAVLANVAVSWLPVRLILRSMMLLASIGFFACSFPSSFAWFFAWRAISGIAGGTLMVLTAPTILPHIPPSRRGIASGAIFTGIGLGIAASGTLVPLLLREGLTQCWLGLGVVSLLLTAIAWNGWPQSEPTHVGQGHATPQIQVDRRIRALFLEYALNAVGLVPHMIFLVDFVARGLGQGIDVGAEFWVLFGFGAMLGPVLSGHLADRIGYGRALPLAYALQMCAIALPAFGLRSGWLMVSSLTIGALTPGIVPLVFGRIQDLLVHQPSAHRRNWTRATIAFALAQALSAYGMSFIFARTHRYTALFAIGSAAMLVALVVNVVASLLFRSHAATTE
jgi:predicted MFS family arabinose efflux permease